MRTEDGEIIHQCLNGKPAAFGFLVDKYKACIFAFAYSELGNFHDAEDITQDVFIKAYQKLNTLKQYDRFLAWLYAITSNLCKNLIRSRRNRPDGEFIEDQAPETLMEPSINSYRESIITESLNEAINSLPKIYSQALTLHYLGGMSVIEIARFLGTTTDAIKHRLSRGRTQLKEEVVAMMSETFGQQKLQASFTFRIIEAVKRIKINPVSTMKGLPWGLSLAAGIIITVMSLNPTLISFNNIGTPIYSPLPSETKVLKIGEISVDVVKTSNVAVLSSKMGKGKGEELKPDMENAFFMAPQGEGGTWTKKADMPTARDTFSASVVDGKIYAIGGWSLGGTLTTVEEYDPVKNTWTKKANMPTARDWLSTTAIDGMIYAIGGQADIGIPTVEMYDPAKDTWTKKADMPTARWCLSTSAVNGKIYAIGGIVGFGPFLSTVEEYDPVKDTWTKKADMPTARLGLSTSVVNDNIYAIGGQPGVGWPAPFSVVEMYDPESDTWTKKADMPTARTQFATAVVNGKIYAIGGKKDGQWSAFSIVEVYDPATDTWTKKDDMPTARRYLSAGAVNGKIYVIGGSDANNIPMGTVEKYDVGFLGVDAKGKLPTKWGQMKRWR
jgi:RNA polymerase sigma factor (sigma-70 family)